MLRIQVSIAAVLVLFTTIDSSAHNDPKVETEIVGSFPGYQWTVPTAVNNRGQVVGFVLPTGTIAGRDAFLWSVGGGFELIAEDAVATDINNRGDVTGYRLECTPTPDGGSSCGLRGFVWNVRGGFIDIGDFVPRAINDSGDMAGECPTADALAACAIHNGIRTQWECDVPSCGQTAAGINARGDVAGSRSSPDFELAMLFPRGGDPIVLGPQTAEDINNAGMIAGRAPTAVWPSNATLWTNTGLLQAPMAATSVAMALNTRGWAVGIRFGSGDDGNDAFFWEAAANSFIVLAPEAGSSEAYDINDRGEIVGFIDTGTHVRQLVIWRVRP